MVKLPFLKINIKRNFCTKENFACKNLGTTNYTKHVPNSKSSWNQYIWVHIWTKRTKCITSLNIGNYHFSYLCLAILFVQKILKNKMWCNFWSKCSLFLSSTLNISYILSYIFWKNPLNGNVSTTYLTNSTKRNTHTSASLHIFLESNYKLVPWLKKFKKVFSSSFVCGLSTISIL